MQKKESLAQQESFAREILSQIAAQQKRPISQVEPFINKLEENWLDTKEALSLLTEKEFEDLGIPKRIGQLIQQLIAEPEKRINPVDYICSQISDQDQLQRTLGTLLKIISNVVENPLSPQFQSISITSKTLENNILKFPSAVQLLQELGWTRSETHLSVTYFVDPKWDQMIELINKKLNQPPQFNPYKASFSSSAGGMTNADVAEREGYNIYSFSEKLQELKMKRWQLMSGTIAREIKIIKGSKNQSIAQMQQQLQDIGEYEEVQPHNDADFIKLIKDLGISLEGEKFASRRKKEYEALINAPLYQETVQRVKMPSDIIIEAKFKPLEQLQGLYDLVKSVSNITLLKVLKDKNMNFYLYTTPPVVKMGEKQLEMSFEDLDSVPNGLFYFGGSGLENVISDEWMGKAKHLE